MLSQLFNLPFCLQNTSCFQLIYHITFCCLHQSFITAINVLYTIKSISNALEWISNSYHISRHIGSIYIRVWVESIIDDFLVFSPISYNQAVWNLSTPLLSSFLLDLSHQYRMIFLCPLLVTNTVDQNDHKSYLQL